MCVRFARGQKKTRLAFARAASYKSELLAMGACVMGVGVCLCVCTRFETNCVYTCASAHERSEYGFNFNRIMKQCAARIRRDYTQYAIVSELQWVCMCVWSEFFSKLTTVSNVRKVCSEPTTTRFRHGIKRIVCRSRDTHRSRGLCNDRTIPEGIRNYNNT